MTALIISDEEMDVWNGWNGHLEEFGSLIKGINKTIKIEAKEPKGGPLGMLLGILIDSLLGNMLVSHFSFPNMFSIRWQV